MSLSSTPTRLRNYYKRNIGKVLFRRPFTIEADRPLISFTFDDFPRTALNVAGNMLALKRLAGTYFVSFSLMGSVGPSGPLFTEHDLDDLVAFGHELGCHTYGHCHSWDTDSDDFEESVIKNREALARLLPGTEFKTFSYPISEPQPMSKMKAARHFLCCRAGGQTFNTGTVDLNRLSAFFLEKSRDNLQAVKDLIELNRAAKGWLIFATHDVASEPSPYGCTPAFFEEVLEYAVDSGARILTVADAMRAMGHENVTGNAAFSTASPTNK